MRSGTHRSFLLCGILVFATTVLAPNPALATWFPLVHVITSVEAQGGLPAATAATPAPPTESSTPVPATNTNMPGPPTSTSAPNPAGDLYVDALSGSNIGNTCQSQLTPCQTIGYALTQAPVSATIHIAAGIYTETIGITQSVALLGAGSRSTIIDGNSRGTVVSVGGIVTITGVTIQHGTFSTFGAAGILNWGNLTLNSVLIISNTGSYAGGAIYNGGTITL